MSDKPTLNLLGCVPMQLNILMELAEASLGATSFRILKNMAVEVRDEFKAASHWRVESIPCYEQDHSFSPDEDYALCVVGVHSKEAVHRFFRDLIKMPDERFANLIHPTSYVSPSVSLDHGLQMEPLSVIAACASIGFGVNIKRSCNVGHHCKLKDFVTINPGVTMSSYVEVGRNTMIGSGAVIKDGITIGENCVIGVGSVVVKDIPANSVAYGNPCKVHKENPRP